MFKNINKSSGQASKMLLILAIVIFVAIIIVFVVMKAVQKPPQPIMASATPAPTPIYEYTANSIRFVFQEAKDMGNNLQASQAIAYKPERELTTTEKFLRVTVAAQNKGKKNTAAGDWGIGNIVDSEGRNFVPIESVANAWLPKENHCGILLEPEFEPVPCAKMYRVSKESAGLKIQILSSVPGKGEKAVNLMDTIITK